MYQVQIGNALKDALSGITEISGYNIEFITAGDFTEQRANRMAVIGIDQVERLHGIDDYKITVSVFIDFFIQDQGGDDEIFCKTVKYISEKLKALNTQAVFTDIPVCGCIFDTVNYNNTQQSYQAKLNLLIYLSY